MTACQRLFKCSINLNEMHNLIIEIGNTALKATWSEGITLGKTFRYQGEKKLEFILGILDGETADVMVISSAGEIPQKWDSLLSKRCRRLILMDTRHKDMNLEYGIPEWLTPDRTASIIASRFLFKGKPVSIFDFGTTLSIDLVSADGNYESGLISPGCRTRFKSVNRYSKSLPLLETPSDCPEKGVSLNSSIEAGIISGMLFEIKGHLDARPENIVVFTGGDAIYFVNKLKNSIFVICNLVLMGLAIIAEKYYESNL